MATSSQAAGDSDKPSSSLPPLDHPDESSSQDETAKMLSATLSGVEKADEGRGDAVEVKESEAVAEEIKEEEGQGVIDEVMRIKAILMIPDQHEDVLFDSLSILQQTNITTDVLQATMIGRAVTPLRKHTSRKIRLFARTLVSDWRIVVDEWYAANPSAEVPVEGLGPSPQVEEGASSAAPTPSAEKKASSGKRAAVAEEEEGRNQLRRIGDETKPSELQGTSTEEAEPVLAQPDPKPGLDEACQMGQDNPTGGVEKPSGVDGSENLGEPDDELKCYEQIE